MFAGDKRACGKGAGRSKSCKQRGHTLDAQTLTDVPAEGTELGAVTFSDPNDGTVYGTVTLVSHGEAQFEEPEPQAVRPQELSREQKRATVIVCSIAVFLLLVFILLLVRRSRRMRGKRR